MTVPASRLSVTEPHQNPPRIAVLISGRGSNLQALLDASDSGRLSARIGLVLSDNPNALGLQRAAESEVPHQVIARREFAGQRPFEAAMTDALDAYDPHLVILAGFMRILSDDFVDRYLGRLINIHPSLLPAFRGLRANEQALAAGVEIHGTSVHFVIPELDAGPVILQAEVPVLPGDNTETLAQRVLQREHQILPLAAQWLVSGRCSLEHGQVIMDGMAREQAPRLKWNENIDEKNG